MEGPKHELAERIVEVMSKIEDNGRSDLWELGYEAWMDTKFALYPDLRRDC